MATHRRQRSRVRIKARLEDLEPPVEKASTQETQKPTPPRAPKPAARSSPPAPPLPPLSTEPQPNEEALAQKDFVQVEDILRNPVLTPAEVGTLLRVSPTTVMKLCQDGDLPSMQMDKQTRMLRIDVLRYMRDLRDRRDRIRRWQEENRQ